MQRLARPLVRTSAAVLGVLLLASCEDPASPHNASDAALDADAATATDTAGAADADVSIDTVGDDARSDVAAPDGTEPPPPAEGVVTGSAPAALADYERMCAACHGTMGEGAIAPRLAGTTRDRDTLIAAINERMPPADPSLCVDDCAERMADAILGWIHPGDADACGYLVAPAPRGMRLLTRRELRNTLVDLLGADASCPPTQFEYAADGAHRTVHVAGSFNGWPGTIAAGGWPMEASGNTWSLTRDLPAGRHSYKFVIDESRWVPDPRAAESESDGFGGSNSVVRVDCATSVDRAAIEAVLDRVDALPPEARPLSFHFETHVQSGAVSSSSLEALLEIGQRAGRLVTPALAEQVAGCVVGTSDGECMRSFVERFASRAWRRPATAAQVQRLAALAATESATSEAIALVAEAVLGSPYFLYRFELGEPRGDGTWELTDWEMASALSYAITGTAPDDALVTAAAAGELSDAGSVEAHARRLLATTGARDAIEAFAEQWLGTERVSTLVRSAAMFPSFDQALRDAMREETRRFVSHVVFDGGGTFRELLTADYAMLNERLAAVYGVSGVAGSELRAVPVTDGRRAGVLTQPAVLATTAHSDQTSPIRRGLLIRQRLLCQDFPPPPPEAGGVPDVDPDASTRDRFAQHTADAVCAGCHQYIDSLGFGFEHYDPIGAWRDREPNGPIDASAALTDVDGFGTGTSYHFDTIPALAGYLAESATARECFVREYRRFVVGDAESPDDACGVRSLDLQFADSETNIQDLMIAVVTDPGFRRRR